MKVTGKELLGENDGKSNEFEFGGVAIEGEREEKDPGNEGSSLDHVGVDEVGDKESAISGGDGNKKAG